MELAIIPIEKPFPFISFAFGGITNIPSFVNFLAAIKTSSPPFQKSFLSPHCPNSFLFWTYFEQFLFLLIYFDKLSFDIANLDTRNGSFR